MHDSNPMSVQMDHHWGSLPLFPTLGHRFLQDDEHIPHPQKLHSSAGIIDLAQHRTPLETMSPRDELPRDEGQRRVGEPDGGRSSDGVGSALPLTIGRRQGGRAASAAAAAADGSGRPSIFDIFSAAGKKGRRAVVTPSVAPIEASGSARVHPRPQIKGGSAMGSPRTSSGGKSLERPSMFGLNRRNSTVHAHGSMVHAGGGDTKEAIISLLSDEDQDEDVAAGAREDPDCPRDAALVAFDDDIGEMQQEPHGGEDFLSIGHMARYGQVASDSMNKVVRNHNISLQNFSFKPITSRNPTAVVSVSPRRRLGEQSCQRNAGGGSHHQQHDVRLASDRQPHQAGSPVPVVRKKAFKTFSRRGK